MENTNLSFSKDDASEPEVTNSKSTNEDMVAIMESQMGQASAVEEKLSELKAQMDIEVTRITTLQDDIDSLHSKREEEQQIIDEIQEKRQQAENELSQVKNELQQAEQEKIRVEQEKKKIAEQKKIKAEQERVKNELDNQKKQESVVKAPAKLKLSPLDEGVMAYKRSQYSDALRILTPLANEGNPIAQYIIATLYREGRGVLSNNALALKWMRKAASQGNTEAQVDLARMYSNGIDGKQDPFLAYTWYLVAERNGSYYVTGEMKKVEALLQTEQFSQALALAKDIGK
jgi:DNA repair exonuclease SbcCD ATPase subunit